MKKQNRYTSIVPWVLTLLFLFSLLIGCAHKQEQEDSDRFFKQWKATAEKSKGYSPKSKKRTITLPPRVLTVAESKQQETKKEKPLPTKKITMRMHQTDVTVLLRALTRAVGLNLVVNENVKGSINIYLQDAAWDQVFMSILNTQGLSYAWDGDIIRIVTLEDKNRSLEHLTTEQDLGEQKRPPIEFCSWFHHFFLRNEMMTHPPRRKVRQLTSQQEARVFQ